MRFYIDGPPYLQITKELTKFVFQKKFKKKKNSSLTEQKKTFDRSDHILKRKMIFSNQNKQTPNRGPCYHFKKKWAKWVMKNKI